MNSYRIFIPRREIFPETEDYAVAQNEKRRFTLEYYGDNQKNFRYFNKNCYYRYTDDPGADGTRLSPIEIDGLSQKLGGDYYRLGLRAGLSDEATNIRNNNFQFPSPESKAAEVLKRINNMSDFSRMELADNLEKIGFGRLADDLLRGRLR